METQSSLTRAYQENLDKLMEEIDNHPVFNSSYFRLLQRSSFTRETYALHRANFFYRTALTAKTIAHLCARAAEQEDQPTLILFSHILDEECGFGDPKQCHTVLMEKAHNVFGQVVFGLEPLPVTESKNSVLIIEETIRYRRRLAKLCDGSYQCVLGVVMALETHAKKMLDHCRTAFRAHADYFEGTQFVNEVEIYFNKHLDGVEQRHADDARDCVKRNCRSSADFADIAHGAREALQVQLAMWQQLYRTAVELRSGREA